ncbi:MAG: oligosaccharide flippase family protein [Cytophagales bacterium]|nr:oligosaccharide flippase family protein [Cytophagales bacterium]
MSVLKKLAGHTLVYGLSTIFARFLNFLLVPLHARTFIPHDFGIIQEVYAYIAFFNIIYTYGMETAYFRFATKTQNSMQNAFDSTFSAIFTSSMVLSGFIFIFSAPIAQLLGIADKQVIVQYVSLLMAVDALVAIPFAKVRLLNKVYLFAGARLSSIFLNIFFNFFYLVFCPLIARGDMFVGFAPYLPYVFYKDNYGVEYVFLSNLLSNLAFIPFLLPVMRRYRFSLDITYLKSILIYSFPILITGIAGTVNEMFSRALLKDLLPTGFYKGITNMAALGIFSAAYKFSVFMTIVIQAFRYASEPFFFSHASAQDAKALYAKVMLYFILVCCFIFCFISINVHWIASIFLGNSLYNEGLVIVPMLLFAAMLLGIYYNLSIWYKLTDMTYWGTYITLGGAAVTIVGNYILIPLYGYVGSVYTTLACYTVMTVASYILGQKYYKVPYAAWRLIAIMLTSYGIVYVLTNIELVKNYDILTDNMILFAIFGCTFVWFYLNNKKSKLILHHEQ